jgi:hypothetical protein
VDLMTHVTRRVRKETRAPQHRPGTTKDARENVRDPVSAMLHAAAVRFCRHSIAPARGVAGTRGRGHMKIWSRAFVDRLGPSP